MIVVHGTGSPLLGLHWITTLQLDLNRIVHSSTHIQRPVGKVNQVKRQAVLRQHNSNFNNSKLDNGLGHCSKVQTYIRYNPAAQPKSGKPRPIAHSAKGPVGDDLNRSKRNGWRAEKDYTLRQSCTDPGGEQAVGSCQNLGRISSQLNPQLKVEE